MNEFVQVYLIKYYPHLFFLGGGGVLHRQRDYMCYSSSAAHVCSFSQRDDVPGSKQNAAACLAPANSHRDLK